MSWEKHKPSGTESMWRELGVNKAGGSAETGLGRLWLARAPELSPRNTVMGMVGPEEEEEEEGLNVCACCGAGSWEGVQRAQRYLEGGPVSPVLCLPSAAPSHLKKSFLSFLKGRV